MPGRMPAPLIWELVPRPGAEYVWLTLPPRATYYVRG